MKQKIWSRAAALVMTICMAITMVPSMALAADSSPIDSLDFTTMETTDNMETDHWKWDADSKILTLNSANFNLSSGVINTTEYNKEKCGILLPDDAVIVLNGKNTLSLSGPNDDTIDEFYAIRATNFLKIIGNGSLDITMTQSAGSVHERLWIRGIRSDSLEIGSGSDSDGPKIKVETNATKSTMGIYASNLFLKKGSLTVNVGDSGIWAKNSVKIASGFSITASYTQNGYACRFHSNDSDGWTVEEIQKIQNSLIDESGTVTKSSDGRDVYITQKQADTSVRLVYQAEPEVVTITGLAAPTETKIYDGHEIADEAFGTPTVTLANGGTTVTNPKLTYTYYQGETALDTAPTNAGTYSVVVSAKESSGYTGTSGEIDFTIEKAPVEFTIGLQVFRVGTTWGEVQKQLPISYGGFDTNLIKKQASYYLNGVDGADSSTVLNKAGVYTFTVTPAEADNYTFTYYCNDKYPANTGDFIISDEYTVNFVTNCDTAIDPVTKLLYDTISPSEVNITREGYTLAGWYTDPAFIHLWKVDSVMGDQVMGNMTLYAKWVENDSLVDYTVNVTSTDSSSTVKVSLKQGDNTIYQKTADSTGKATFSKIVPGMYTLEVKEGNNCSTQVVTVPGNSQISVTVPEKVSAKLNVWENTPAVMANGLNEEATAHQESKTNSVALTLNIKSKNADQVEEAERGAIENLTSGKQRNYLDAELLLYVDNQKTEITSTNTVLELIVPFDMSGKYNLGVYRYHGDKAESFQQAQKNGSHEDGQFYLDGNYIHIFASKFSTYAIAYTTSSGSSSSSSGSSSGGSYGVDVPAKTEGGSVTVSPKSASKGSTVTITVTPDQGYALKDLTVTDKDGKQVQLTEKDGKYTFTMPAGKVSVQASFAKEAPAQSFTDVPATAYYYDAVQWAAEQGITGGVGDGLFAPEQGCTRGQIVTFLWRAAGSPEPKALSAYVDVPADAYYAKAVAWAVENGITVGTSETTFSPDMTCTRAHGVTFLYRAAKAEPTAASTAFTDVDANAYYAKAVTWAVENGITNGVSSTLFGPDGTCTRAQIVTFLYRAEHK